MLSIPYKIKKRISKHGLCLVYPNSIGNTITCKEWIQNGYMRISLPMYFDIQSWNRNPTKDNMDPYFFYPSSKQPICLQYILNEIGIHNMIGTPSISDISYPIRLMRPHWKKRPDHSYINKIRVEIWLFIEGNFKNTLNKISKIYL